VRGPGVVGEQPVLTTGESFQYTSGCPLKTSTGVMRGTYQMVTEEGDRFDVEIAPFALHEPTPFTNPARIFCSDSEEGGSERAVPRQRRAYLPST